MKFKIFVVFLVIITISCNLKRNPGSWRKISLKYQGFVEYYKDSGYISHELVIDRIIDRDSNSDHYVVFNVKSGKRDTIIKYLNEEILMIKYPDRSGYFVGFDSIVTNLVLFTANKTFNHDTIINSQKRTVTLQGDSRAAFFQFKKRKIDNRLPLRIRHDGIFLFKIDTQYGFLRNEGELHNGILVSYTSWNNGSIDSSRKYYRFEKLNLKKMKKLK